MRLGPFYALSCHVELQGREVETVRTLDLSIDLSEWSSSLFIRFVHCTYWILGWVDARAGMVRMITSEPSLVV
jgi:hypothetical protein